MKLYESRIATGINIHAKNYIHTFARADKPIVKKAVFLQATQATMLPMLDLIIKISSFVLGLLVTASE